MNPIPYMLLSALIMVESGGNDRAVNSQSGAVGCLQITPILLKDMRRITGQQFSTKDALDRRRSCEIALVYLSYYATEERLGRPPTMRDYALIWRHGPDGWKRKGHSPYWSKVTAYLQ